MIVVKSSLSVLPEYCDDCIYYECRPHPYKGWTECCNLCCQSIDDDVEDGWIYDENDRPKNCPLIEVPDMRGEQDAERKTGKWIYHPEIGWVCSECGEKTVSTVMGKPRYKWCPMCGSKMTEDNQ